MKATFQRQEQKYYNREYERNVAQGYPQLDWRSLKANTSFIKEVQKVLKKGDKVLDLGCGIGRLSFALTKSGFELWGIDFAPTAIIRAKKLATRLGYKTRTHFETGDALDLPYQKAFFNVIIDYGCLHHIKQKLWKRYLTNVMKVLKPDGYLVLYTHGRGSKFHRAHAPKKDGNEFIVEDVLTHFFEKEDFEWLFKKDFTIMSAKRHRHPATPNKLMWTAMLKRKQNSDTHVK